MNISLTSRSAFSPDIEFVERKGTGHPDTICDILTEELACHLASKYLENTGAVRHFNVDKAILAAGSVNVEFGGGECVEPARLVIVGRATFAYDWSPDVEELSVRYHERLMELLPDADPGAFTVEVWLKRPSSDLAAVLHSGRSIPLSNDTSFAAVSTPRSVLESIVHSVEVNLNSDEYRALTPIGRDIKVMGARIDDKISLTVACPVLANSVRDRDEYDALLESVKGEITRTASEITDRNVSVMINQADQEDSVYLSLSGTSAEAGDDGQVGRGNRFGGLITPYRPMSLEATAGKNPAAHVGKTYHAIGYDIATRLVDETETTEATVRLLSSIGHPVTEPQSLHVEVTGEPDLETINSISRECLHDWSGVTERLINGEYELY